MIRCRLASFALGFASSAIFASAQVVVVEQVPSVLQANCYWSIDSACVGISGMGDYDGDGWPDYLVSRFQYVTIIGGIKELHSCPHRPPGLPNEVRSGRDGSLLGEFDAQASSFLLSSPDAQGPLGDLDGDGLGDFYVGQHVFLGSGGSVNVGFDPSSRRFSVGDVDADGRDDIAMHSSTVASFHTGADLLTLPARSLGWEGVGDFDADGHDDVLSREQTGGLPSVYTARVLSGRTGAVLFERDTVRAATWLGDVDLDGFDDLAHHDGVLLQIVSGATGAVTMSRSMPFDEPLVSVSDWDGDGVPDLAVGPRLVVSGASLANLYRVLDANRSIASGGSDVNGNGRHEIVVAEPGSRFLFELDSPTSRAFPRPIGAGCEGSTGRIPRIDFRGVPRLGGSMIVRLEAARPGTLAVLHVGQPFSVGPIDLAILGAPGCLLRSDPFVAVPKFTSATGFTTVALSLPIDAAPAGFEYSAQWVTSDSAANALGVTVSGELRLRVAF